MTLKNEDEYRAALAEVSPYFDGPEPEQMPARVSELLHAIEAYEREFYPVPSLPCHGGAMNTGFLKMQHERFMQAAQKFDDGRKKSAFQGAFSFTSFLHHQVGCCLGHLLMALPFAQPVGGCLGCCSCCPLL